MSNCLSPSQLRALALRDVAVSEIEGAESHLRECVDCRRRLAELEMHGRDEAAPTDAVTQTTPGDGAGGGPGRRVDRAATVDIPGYSRLELIGRGGQGTVYSAVQDSTRRRVALKILAGSAHLPAQRARFKREVETLASIAHPAIVTVFDSGAAGDRVFYSMEYIRGRPVTAHLRAQQPAVRDILALFAEIADAVGAAHARGIIHRDIKPTNILVDDAGHPHVLDFGLAKDMGPGSALLQVTDTGEFVGTLAYAAPEQRRAAQLDARADVYSLGVVLYEALTGQMPYKLSGDLPEDILRIFDGEIRSPSRTGAVVDADVDAIVLCALAKEPVRRYATCNELAEDLHRYLNGESIRARRDTTGYVLRKNAARLARQHPLLAIFVGWALSVILGVILLTTPFVRPVDRWFETRAVAWAGAGAAAGWSDALAFIAIDDSTYDDIPRLVNTLGLPVVKQSDVLSWRVMHGRLMERLALAPPRVVAWDINFGATQPEFDQAFVAGARALRGAGTQIILAVKAIGLSGQPAISPDLMQAVDGWGWYWLAKTTGIVPSAALAIDAPPHPTSAGLALRTYAAFHEPDSDAFIVWHAEEDRIEVRYRMRSFDGANDPWKPNIDHVAISHEDTCEPQSLGFPATAERPRAAYTWISLPAPEVLARQTSSYREVLMLKEAELQRHFAGRIVFVSDNRQRTKSDPDRKMFVAVGGPREDFAVYAHAAAVSNLLKRAVLSRPRRLEGVLLLGSATVGVAVAFAARHLRGWLRPAAAFGLLMVLATGLAVGMVVRSRGVISIATVILVSCNAAAWTLQVLRQIVNMPAVDNRRTNSRTENLAC